MPDVRLPSGKIIKGVPEGTPKEEVMRKAIAAGLATESDFQGAQNASERGLVDSSSGVADSVPKQQEQPGALYEAGNLGLEFASAFNRGATKLADFLTTDQINAVSQILGSEFRVPSITNMLSPATQGGFAQEGLARDVVRGAGEVIPAAVGAGATLARAGSQLPAFTAATEGVLPGVLRQAGSTSIAAEGALGAASGAGSVLGGEAGGAIGEAVGGEQGRAIGETVGSVAGGIVAPVGAAVSAERLKTAAKNLQVDSELAKSLPSIEQLKTASRQIFKEIDDSGAKLKPVATNALYQDAQDAARRLGVDRDVTPKAARALARIEELAGSNPTISEVETVRRIAQNAAKSLDPPDAAAGAALVDSVDSFIDKLTPNAFLSGRQAPENLGPRFQEARKLWGRAKKAEMIEEAITKARDQASGFENGLRVQFRQIVNSKKKSRFFSKPELDAMKKVVQGTKSANLARVIGGLGISEGGARNILGAGTGALAGGAALGTPGAIIVPVVGQVSRQLAQKLTSNNAKFADQVIRAGNNGRRIAETYMRNVPKGQRSAEELSELLIRNEINLGDMPDSQLMQQAASMAQQARAVLAAQAAQEEEQ